MNNIRFRLFTLLAVIVLAAGLAGCVKKEFDVPPVYIPKVDFNSNVTIKGLKNMSTGSLMQITADTIIQGIVTANDESGNIYKKLYIQDNTAGIEIGIDVTSLYTTYKLGQRVFIKCQGLYLGQYGGVIQLGYIYNNAIGRIPSSMVASHFFLDSIPGAVPAADTLDISQSATWPDKMSTLVAIKNVRFADSTATFVTEGESYTNLTIANESGNAIEVDNQVFILRTSTYANFAQNRVPTGKGTLVGVLSQFNGQYQLYIRDTADCVGFDHASIPPVVPNATIAGLKSILGSQTLLQIAVDSVIQGVVTANDESGNIYKTIYIQDNTGGIEVKLDETYLSETYPLGQKVSIKCKDLYLGLYGGSIQLGYIYNGTIGRIPSSLIDSHLFKQGVPGAVPLPDTLNLAAPATLGAKLSTLVAVKAVMFPDAGQTYAITGQTTNRDIADSTGTVIKINGKNFILRTSNYANFATEPMPAGIGTLVGILSRYNDQYQMYIRDTNDCVNFSASGMVTTIYQQNFDVAPSNWTVYSIASNKDWAWDSQYQVMVANGYQGDVASEDWLISPAIDLTGVSQTILNFKTWTQFTDSGLANPFDVWISINYSGSGNPTAATWTPVTCILPAANSKVWTSSGDIDLSMYNQKVYIGYRYRSSGTASSSASKWEVDTFKVTGIR